jgi:bacillithiol synthase
VQLWSLHSNLALANHCILAHSYTHIPYSQTGYFSKLATAYLAQDAAIKPFFHFSPNVAGISKAIEERAAFPTDRELLVSALNRQYEGLPASPLVQKNIASLISLNTYTITTAHQPNLLTGYLYFIYKILHAIKLAEQLNGQHPDKHFVPVYYMGSEDNDIEELGVFRFRGEKYSWDGDGQGGAVGRMDTAGLKPILERLFRLLGPPGANCDELQNMLTEAYLRHATIARATQYLVNELFGRYGLVILNPDDASFKAAFIPVMEDELLHSNAYPIITAQTEMLEANYKAQMFPRPINLFYLDTQLRERIEKKGDKWVVVNTDIQFSKEELLEELHAHPEKFSPNVALRGLYQETILPNVAFIGGGAEVAYWLQLSTLFSHYKVFYPTILLRQSVLWIDPVQAKLRLQTELSLQNIFRQDAQLVRDYVDTHSTNDWHTSTESEEIARLFQKLRDKATTLDPTLKSAAEAALTKMKHQLSVLETKMLRAEKKKMQVQLQRIARLRNALFPGNSLQERTENFTEYYLQYGADFFDMVKDGIEPLSGNFLVVESAN